MGEEFGLSVDDKRRNRASRMSLVLEVLCVRGWKAPVSGVCGVEATTGEPGGC